MGAWSCSMQVLDGLEHGSQAERPVERHRPGGGPDGGGGSPGAAGEVRLEVGDVAEGRRHEDQLRVGEGQERHLPRPPAFGVGVEVELVHHRLPDVRAVAAAQGQVGEDLGRAADDRRAGVHRRVARHHPDVLASERVAQVEELLAHEGLDGGRVEGAPTLGQRREVGAGGHQALPRAGRRRHDHVAARHDLDEGLLLRRVQDQPAIANPPREGVEQRIGGGVRREAVSEEQQGRHPAPRSRWLRRCAAGRPARAPSRPSPTAETGRRPTRSRR